MEEVWKGALYALKATEEYVADASAAVEQEVSYLATAFSFSTSVHITPEEETAASEENPHSTTGTPLSPSSEGTASEAKPDSSILASTLAYVQPFSPAAQQFDETSVLIPSEGDTKAMHETETIVTKDTVAISAVQAPVVMEGKRTGHVHYAGQSMQYVVKPEAVFPDNFPSNTYCDCDASTFQMRVGPNYDWNKSKAPSPPQLMEIVGIDCFHTSSRVDDIGSKVHFPESWLERRPANALIPPLFIVNFQVPSSFGTSFFKEITDGDGWSLVLYFRLTQETLGNINNVASASPATKLFVEYVSKAPQDDHNANSEYRGKFKISVRCDNIEEFGLPSFITSYNAKPVLIRHTGSLTRGKDYVEMDINVHKFGSVPKKALEMLIGRFDQMKIAMGFCIESRKDDEMPETLFGCVSMNKPSTKWPAVHPHLLRKKHS